MVRGSLRRKAVSASPLARTRTALRAGASRSLRRPGDKSYGNTWSFEPKRGSIPEKTENEKMGIITLN